jgi:hypothetical protein
LSVAAIAAVAALVAGGITVGLIAILHVLKPEYDPSWRMISEYSLGRNGWVMRLAFVTMAICLAATTVALWPFAGAWTIALAAVAGGALGAAFIDADPIMTPRAQATPTGRAVRLRSESAGRTGSASSPTWHGWFWPLSAC